MDFTLSKQSEGHFLGGTEVLILWGQNNNLLIILFHKSTCVNMKYLFDNISVNYIAFFKDDVGKAYFVRVFGYGSSIFVLPNR